MRGRPKELVPQLLQVKPSLATQAFHHFSPSFTPELLHFSPCSFHGISNSQMDTEDGAAASSYVWDFIYLFIFVFGDIFKPKFCDLKTIYIDCCVDFYVISPELHAPNLTRFLDCFTLDILSWNYKKKPLEKREIPYKVCSSTTANSIANLV